MELQPSTPLQTCRIALLGAESTGKTALAQGIQAHFQAQGIPAALVPEYLRTWCDTAGRTPRPEEQQGIAQEHARQATASTHARLLVADTTPLMVAVYSDFLFGDRSLYPFALEHQRSYQLTLLTGLDLPWVADGLQRDGAHVREPVDALVRAALDSAGIGYRIVYGRGSARLDNALFAINSEASCANLLRAKASFRSENVTTRPWACDTCSDPDCEHRLFSALLGG
jgi:nicotinamide riboside kinase